MHTSTTSAHWEAPVVLEKAARELPKGATLYHRLLPRELLPFPPARPSPLATGLKPGWTPARVTSCAEPQDCSGAELPGHVSWGCAGCSAPQGGARV